MPLIRVERNGCLGRRGDKGGLGGLKGKVEGEGWGYVEREVLVRHHSSESIVSWGDLSREERAGHSAVQMVGLGLLIWQATILQRKAWH